MIIREDTGGYSDENLATFPNFQLNSPGFSFYALQDVRQK